MCTHVPTVTLIRPKITMGSSDGEKKGRTAVRDHQLRRSQYVWACSR
jgi:hypothetical protein